MCPSVLVLITHIAGRHAQSVNTASAANTLALVLSPTGLPVRPPARSEEAGRLRNAVAASARWSYLPLAKSYCRYSAMKILSNQPKVSAGDNSGRGHRWRCVRVLARCFNQLKHVN